MSVPHAYVGLWQRTGIWRSNGTSDLTTRVLWIQAPLFHIDLRVSLDRSAVTAFAGRTVVEGERCEWQPEFAYPSLSGELDAGFMRFDAPDQLHERGVDGSYDEQWQRLDAGPVRSLRHPLNDGAIAFAIASERWLALALGGHNSFAFARRQADGWRVELCNNAQHEGSMLPDLALGDLTSLL
ncbi:MAG: hypothetical protein ACJ8GW_11010 [Massilia sp.]